MDRNKMIQNLERERWDIIIVGGGATGLGAAVDAASRGYKTLLLEQSDFAKGTSSRSTKLIHGGLRYLQQGNIGLVTEALRERGLLCDNAPHLVHHLPFLVPLYHWWEGPFYGIGLKVYDLLAGKLGLEQSRHLSRKQTLQAIPTIERKDLRGGALYYDGQFDDSRLAITLARTAADQGATLINYMQVSSFLKKDKKIDGVRAKDLETGKHYNLKAKVVINATGIFSDKLRKTDDKKAKTLMEPSQGIHLVLPASFLPNHTAILVPHTDDKRVIFLVPWHGKVLIGTTDILVESASLEPKPLKEEIDFLLKHAARYLHQAPTKKDILSIYAGQRPLIKASGKKAADISRDHVITVSKSGLVTIAGGKWTTFRKMAQDVINKAISIAKLPYRACITTDLQLHGYEKEADRTQHWSLYGTDAKAIKNLIRKNTKLGKRITSSLPYTLAEVIWATRVEMARSVEDILARRTRILFLDARAAIIAAPLVARLIAKELKKSPAWQAKQVREFTRVAKNYLP
ncbi:MAG TPA: glycerol-3-phosphate dehydrogenase/oxidase [Rhabdochlamydiaceae bacterium]|jgi:glycerol-3-phosphate dehydrogenase|nr:glycerol-3-phosphate dehydrogenase/oxidase [Rhabdochlamydiaceae bacterium]